MFEDECFKTYADGGSVKVGNENFSVCISNGYSDGETRVAVFKKPDLFNDSMMKYTKHI